MQALEPYECIIFCWYSGLGGCVCLLKLRGGGRDCGENCGMVFWFCTRRGIGGGSGGGGGGVVLWFGTGRGMGAGALGRGIGSWFGIRRGNGGGGGGPGKGPWFGIRRRHGIGGTCGREKRGGGGGGGGGMAPFLGITDGGAENALSGAYIGKFEACALVTSKPRWLGSYMNGAYGYCMSALS